MKRLMFILISIVLCGCSSVHDEQDTEQAAIDEVSYPVSTYLNEEMKEIAKQNHVMIEIAKKPQEFAAEADYIVLASVISLDHGETILPDGQPSQLGFTFGKMLIQATYKGESLTNDVVEYMKPGGVLLEEQIDEARPEEQRHAWERSDSPRYVNTTTLSCDVAFEEGKTYFMALCYNEAFDCYEVSGYGLLTREADIEQVQVVKPLNDIDGVKLKNIITRNEQSIEETLIELQNEVD